jgi:hypothetical protein
VRIRPAAAFAVVFILLAVGSLATSGTTTSARQTNRAEPSEKVTLGPPLDRERVTVTKMPTPRPSPQRSATTDNGTPAPSQTPTRMSTTTQNDRAVSMIGRAPLTGMPAETAALAHAAVAIKVSNENSAHPQRGLAEADVVFVELITTATTRLAAVFHSVFPELVGPVRSVRPMDAALLGPTRGVFGNTMAADWVLAYVHDVADVDDFGTLTVSGTGSYRIDNRRRSPNHVFASPAAMLSLSARQRPPPPYFRYAADAAHSTAAIAGSMVNRVDIGYGDAASAAWRYDVAGGRGLRSEGRGPHILDDGTQVSATNVLVLRGLRDQTTFPEAGDGMVVLDFVDASGPVELLTGGQSVSGRWTKAGVNDPFTFTDARGKPLLFAPGNTWVECVGEDVPVAVSVDP